MIAEGTKLPPLFFYSTDLLRDLEDAVEFLGESIHILSDLVIGDAGIYLGRGDPFMPKHLADCFQRYALRKRNRRSECMSCHVHRRVERQPGMFGDMTQRHIHRIAIFGRKDLAIR